MTAWQPVSVLGESPSRDENGPDVKVQLLKQQYSSSATTSRVAANVEQARGAQDVQPQTLKVSYIDRASFFI